MMDKTRIVTRCTDGCKHCEWMFGSPRCLHSDMETRNIEDDPCDPCLYQKVPTDSRHFHPDCPLGDSTNLIQEMIIALHKIDVLINDGQQPEKYVSAYISEDAGKTRGLKKV